MKRGAEPARRPREARETSTRSRAPAHGLGCKKEHLSASEVRERAVSAVAIDVLRGFGVRFLALIGMVVLARLLTPHDFGIVAVGATFVIFANFVADGGIGTALIRRSKPPERADLKALLAFQLGLNTALAVGVSVVAVAIRRVGSSDSRHGEHSSVDGFSRAGCDPLGAKAQLQTVRGCRDC